MESIYDDLDNYEDINKVEELKKENHELKLKLEEYTNTMSNLQKEFDKLSSDFKTLEMNYSSLLKTAKVEIERKTKIITDLNIEKDMMIINALKNGNVKDVRRLKSITKPFAKGPVNAKERGNVPRADNIKDKSSDSGRKEDIRFSSVETSTSGNTDINAKLIQCANSNSEKAELWSDRTSDTKENMSQRNKNMENNDKPATQALSIKNRRKSMPVARLHGNYSSDEECEERLKSNDARKSSRDRRKNINQGYSDRHRYKDLEESRKSPDMSRMDDKYYGYGEPNRDTYHRSRTDRHHGSDKHRRHKHDFSHRQRRHGSPERSHRGFKNDVNLKQEYNRHRVLESPPPDKYQHHHQKRPEARFKRDRDDAYEDKRDVHHYDKHSSKHKSSSERFDEPISKRQRTDSFNKFTEEDTRWSREKPLERLLPDENLQPGLSCQSPDYNFTDTVSSHPIREIMHTATSSGEDPRKHSERYVLENSDGIIVWKTVADRNVDLKMVDTTLWNTSPVEVPKSLTRRPSQCSEDIVKEIYMDIDNPVSNMSLESGEILPFDEEVNMTDMRRVPNESGTRRYDQTTDTELMKPNKNADNNSLSRYKIPKIKGDKDNRSYTDRDTEFRQSEKKITQPFGKYHKATSSEIRPETDLKNKAQVENDNLSKSKIKDDHFALNYEENYNGVGVVTPSMEELVEGDLHLSDETSDNVEIIKSTANEKTHSKDKCHTGHENFATLQKKVEQKDNFVEKTIEKEKSQEKPSVTAQDDCKKRSSKKKHSKHKETKLEKSDSTDNDKETDKVKSKKDSKEIKTKFSELFGDSSSLISPEDLGILSAQAQTQSTAPYIPVCEDAQDAVDIAASSVGKVQTRLSKLKSDQLQEGQDIDKVETDRTEIKSKIQTKLPSEAKKKTRKNPDNDKSKIREVYQSLVANKLVEEKKEWTRNLTVNEPNINQIAADTIEADPNQQITPSSEANEPLGKQKASDTIKNKQAVKHRRSTIYDDKPVVKQMTPDPIEDKPPVIVTVVSMTAAAVADTGIKQVVSDTTSKEPCQPVSENVDLREQQSILIDNPKQSVEEHKVLVSIPKNDVLDKPSILMRALATSTPQKEVQPNDSGMKTVEGAQESSSKDVSKDNVMADQSSNNESVDNQKDADIPDVRIFVKRKRRVKAPKQ
ncbi:uncharacterized protein LOC114352345 isoform X1 [Ostrinia furnacalis]|uniref:uncharacterized protein LOC114352345 isoform X1 n=1 Tax=Ostrinia furnacalis TaxID=93504 RepID=UPI00103C5ED5|nr:uncharacterized protein LOC114352345 isoform X1 [Ostrinia furnacalis]